MEALTSSQPGQPPRHVAIIMDGNGRWAKARGLPRAAGHQRGASAVRKVVEGWGWPFPAAPTKDPVMV